MRRAARPMLITSAAIDGNGLVHISWTQLGLQGKVLPTYRTLIVRHTDPSSAVPSYELFQILFPGPVD